MRRCVNRGFSFFNSSFDAPYAKLEFMYKQAGIRLTNQSNFQMISSYKFNLTDHYFKSL